MKKNKLLLVCSLVLGVPSVVMGLGQTETITRAADVNHELVTSCDFTTQKTGNTSYVSSWTYDTNWNVFGGANSNKGWNYVKLGGKKTNLATANPVYINNKTSIEKEISKIEVITNVGNLSKAGSVNSWGVYVYSDAEMTNQIDYVAGASMTKSKAETLTLVPSSGIAWSANSYYKIAFDLTNTTTTNGVVWLDKIDFYTTVSSDRTFYDVTFNANGGLIGGQEGVTEKVLPVEEGKTVGTLPEATRDRYKFLGWYDSSDQLFTAETIVNSALTLTAKWEPITYYTVTFDTNGGTAIEDKEYEAGSKLVLEELETTNPGKKLSSWLKEDGTAWDFENDVVNSNLVLTAQWEEFSIEENTKYTYSFVGFNGFSEWTATYSEHPVASSDISELVPTGNFVFASADKQSSTITNMPVTKGSDVTFELTQAGFAIKEFGFTCKQWGSKAQTMSLHYSSDGVNYTTLSETSSNFSLSSGDLSGKGVTNVKLTFNNSSNQVGIESFYCVLEKVETTIIEGLETFKASKTEVSLGLNYTIDAEQNYTFSDLRLFFRFAFDYSIFTNATIEETGIYFALGNTVGAIEGPSKIVDTEKDGEFIVELNAPATKEEVKAMLATDFTVVSFVKINGEYFTGESRTLNFETILLDYSDETVFGAEIAKIAEEAYFYYAA